MGPPPSRRRCAGRTPAPAATAEAHQRRAPLAEGAPLRPAPTAVVVEPRRYALVEYGTKQEAQAAIDEMDGKELLTQVGGASASCFTVADLVAAGSAARAEGKTVVGRLPAGGSSRSRPASAACTGSRLRKRRSACCGTWPHPLPYPALNAPQIVRADWAFSSGPLRRARR